MEHRIHADANQGVVDKHLRRKLEEFPLIKLLPKESILVVQREHWLVLVQRMVLCLLLFLLLFSVIFFLSQSDIFLPFARISTLLSYLFFTGICILLVIELYIFLLWYYQFYIITTRCMVNIHFFRIGGFYMEEVFLDLISQQEIKRRAPNFLFDLLGLYDLLVYFSMQERTEPFVFKTPQNVGVIENVLEGLTLKEIEKREERNG